ncbi:UPF0262 family protein [Bartonella sp. DGB2]|uniref:UPF0262 family protein n=1 Tax=Bartonella sp. DGB2 TaxID=3388426 RepID=UPI00398FD43E
MKANRLIAIELDATIGRAAPEIEHERAIAIFDLLEDNQFYPEGDRLGGPYRLRLSLVDKRLIFNIARSQGEWVTTHILSLNPLRRVIKDYAFICESYYEAIRCASLNKIETIDMGRRGLHNEGAHILRERLKGKICFDDKTARRLFTLLCVLHWRG